jgi:hypothetical protein
LSAVAKTLNRDISTKGRKPYTHVFLAMHVFRYEDGHDNIRVIGIFSSKRRAQEAIRHLRDKPGFRYRKRAFEVSRYVLDLRHWTEGFGGGPLARQVRVAPKSVK